MQRLYDDRAVVNFFCFPNVSKNTHPLSEFLEHSSEGDGGSLCGCLGMGLGVGS